MLRTMTRAAGFRKTTNQASIAADFQFAMVTKTERRPGAAFLDLSKSIESWCALPLDAPTPARRTTRRA